MAKIPLSQVAVEAGNVSAGGDFPVVVADPTTPGQKLAIDASGRITVLTSGTGDFNLKQYGGVAVGPANPLDVQIVELPTAVALSDALGNPTTSIIGAAQLLWDPVAAALIRARGITSATTGVFNTGAQAVELLIHDGANLRPLMAAANVNDGGGGAQALGASLILVNGGGTLDRARNNQKGTLLASAARTGTTSSASQVNYNGLGCRVLLNITAVPGVDTITVSIQEQDDITSAWVTILSSAAHLTTGQKNVLVVYPGIAAIANEAVSTLLPRIWRVTVTHSGAGSFTYSLAYSVN